MTTFGKMLVFLNLILGMAFLSWSVGLFTQKVDWLDRTNFAGEKVEGEISRLKSQIGQLTLQARIASASWGTAYEELTKVEKEREDRKTAFAQRLVWARTGDPMGRGFFQDQLLPGTGLINTEQLGPVINGPDGKPLRGAETLSQSIEANDKTVEQYIKDIADLKRQQKEEQRSEKLYQLKLDKHAAFFDQLLNEQIYLEAFEINWSELLRTVSRRKTQLLERLMEY